MKPFRKIALEALRLMKEGRTLSALALVGVQGVALRGEMRILESLLGQSLSDAVAFAAFLPRSPWIYKAPQPKRPRDGWRELIPLLHALQDPKDIEAVALLRYEGTWPEVRFLQVLFKRPREEVPLEDIGFAARFLWKRRRAVERLGIGEVVGPFIPVPPPGEGEKGGEKEGEEAAIGSKAVGTKASGESV